MKADILLVAEIGSHAGLGHVVRTSILEKILDDGNNIDLWVINRDGWTDQQVEERFSPRRKHYDIVIADGLKLSTMIKAKVSCGYLASLSYVSDINNQCDCIIAPALHSHSVAENVITDLDALIVRAFNPEQAFTPRATKGQKPVAYVSLGGTDADHVGGRYDQGLEDLGFDIRHHSMFTEPTDLQTFVLDKFEGSSHPENPGHPRAMDANIILAQRGLTAVELSLQKTPLFLRNRRGFSPAYEFLQRLPWVQFVDDESFQDTIRECDAMTTSSSVMTDAGQHVYDQLRNNVQTRATFWGHFIWRVQSAKRTAAL